MRFLLLAFASLAMAQDVSRDFNQIILPVLERNCATCHNPAKAKGPAFLKAKTLAEMEAATLETIRKNGLQDGYIRLLVTRGKGNLGLSPDRCPKASVIIIAATIQLYPPEAYERGMTVVTCATRRASPAAEVAP